MAASTNNDLGLYISFPFCRSKCTYCNFASGVYPARDHERYVARLIEDLRAAPAWATQMGVHLPRSVDSVYFGGGTPSLLSPHLLGQLFTAMRAEFSLDPAAEITVECAPGQIADDTLESLAACGVNRVSLGVQSFIDREAQVSGRLHARTIVLEDLRRLRAAGITNLNLDLIAGLAGQTSASWEESLSVLIESAVPHASIYMLEVDEDSRLGREMIAGGSRYFSALVPTDDAIADMYLHAVERLASAGLRQYEISNFARPRHQSRHNLRYWQRRPYLGLGLDASSMLYALPDTADTRTGPINGLVSGHDNRHAEKNGLVTGHDLPGSPATGPGRWGGFSRAEKAKDHVTGHDLPGSPATGPGRWGGFSRAEKAKDHVTGHDLPGSPATGPGRWGGFSRAEKAKDPVTGHDLPGSPATGPGRWGGFSRAEKAKDPVTGHDFSRAEKAPKDAGLQPLRDAPSRYKRIHETVSTPPYILRSSVTDDLTAFLAAPSPVETAWLSPTRQFEEAWFLGLRMNAGVKLSALRRGLGREPVAAALPTIARLVTEGLLTSDSKTVRLTAQGRLLSNDVFQQFLGSDSSQDSDQYPGNDSRHASQDREAELTAR